MPRFKVTLDDGRRITVEASDEQQAGATVQRFLAEQGPSSRPGVSAPPAGPSSAGRLVFPTSVVPGLRGLLTPDTSPSQRSTGVGAPAAFAQRVGRQAFDALGNIIPASGELVSSAAAALHAPFSPLTFAQMREQARQVFPASALIAGPRISSADLTGGAQALGGLLDPDSTIAERFRAGKQADIDFQQRLAQEHPIATGAGNIVGDAATLATGRVAMTGRLVEMQQMQKARQLATAATTRNLGPGARRVLERTLRGVKDSKFQRGVGRVAETGIEGAIMGALHDADPAQTALYAATAQAAGSASLGTLSAVMKSKAGVLGGLTGTALGLAGAHQLFKSASPGGRDRILESVEGGFNETVTLVGLGLAAGLAGLSRGRNSALFEDLPRVVEGTTATLRGSLLSVMTGMADELNRGVSTTGPTIEHYVADPDSFRPAWRKAIERGIQTGDLSEITQRLAATDEEFARLIDSPLPDPGEVAQRRLRTAIEADNGPSAAQIVVDMRETASAIKRRLPADLQERFSALNPQQAISRALEHSPNVLNRLRTHQRVDALEINLTELISRSIVSDPQNRERRIVDPQRLESQWSALSESVRDAYSPRQREAIERFIDEARAPNGLAVLPPLLARSLMLPDGALSRRLRGEVVTESTNED